MKLKSFLFWIIINMITFNFIFLVWKQGILFIIAQILIALMLTIIFLKINYFLLKKSAKFMLKSKNKKIWLLFFIFRFIIFIIFLGFIITFNYKSAIMLLTFVAIYLLYTFYLFFLLIIKKRDVKRQDAINNFQFI